MTGKTEFSKADLKDLDNMLQVMANAGANKRFSKMESFGFEDYTRFSYLNKLLYELIGGELLQYSKDDNGFIYNIGLNEEGVHFANNGGFSNLERNKKFSRLGEKTLDKLLPLIGAVIGAKLSN